MYFIAPKNFKRGRLIGNKYRLIDLVISISLILVSVIMVLVYVVNGGANIFVVLFMLLPLLAAAFILLPLGFYHNVIQRIILWVYFKAGRRSWKWQGIYRYTKPNDKE